MSPTARKRATFPRWPSKRPVPVTLAAFAILVGAAGFTPPARAEGSIAARAEGSIAARAEGHTGSTPSATQASAPPLARAKELFETYVRLGRSFDVGVADLYADSARIVNRRRYPNGETRTLNLDGSRYKELIRSTMGLAQATGDRDAFSRIQYRLEGGRVRIRATRFSERKKYSSPFTMLVGPDASGRWVVFEETSESRP